MKVLNPLVSKRLWVLLSLAVLIPVGFYSKAYHGPGFQWVNANGGGFFYVIFWCLVIFGMLPTLRPLNIAVVVVVLTCLVEFSQLLHHPILSYVRSTFIGQTVFGRTFSWYDMPFYGAGGLCAFLWLMWIDR